MSACEGAPDAEIGILKNKKGFLRVYIVFVDRRICIDFDLHDGENAKLVMEDLMAALEEDDRVTYLDFGSRESSDRNFETTFRTVPEMIRYLRQYGFRFIFSSRS